MTSPAPDQQARRRLDRLMDQRRAELRMRWKDVAARAGLTTEGLGGVRKGTGGIRALTKRGIEDALHWAPGSVERILEGGDPLPADHPPADAMGATEAILDDMERRVADMKRLSRRDLAAIDALIEALKNPDPNDAPADNNHR